MTLLLVVGFFLHSIFILIVILLTSPSAVFSFCGLIITEVTPVGLVLGKNKQTNKQTNKHKQTNNHNQTNKHNQKNYSSTCNSSKKNSETN